MKVQRGQAREQRRTRQVIAALNLRIVVLAAIIETIWGLAAERRPLETVARPLSSAKD